MWLRPVPVLGSCLALLAASGCSTSAGGNNGTTFGTTAGTATTTSTTVTASDTNGTDSTSDGTDSGTTAGTSSGTGSTGSDTESLDVPAPTSGCSYVDMLFVVDNSESMETYQAALADEFPSFVDAMFAELPANISLHVGLTTTDFDTGCSGLESTAMCQSTAAPDDILMHYVKPTDFNDGGNGSQGRLFEWNQKRYFEISTNDDPSELKTWFTGAATAAGENGCSFEMPVAAAGWAFDPANDATNGGFVRDAGGLLVIFFLTDEPDKSPDSKSTHEAQVAAAKTECGGNECVFVAGLVPPCVSEINQKLWQFMKLYSDTPDWADIADTNNYSALVGQTLATAVAEACQKIPPVG